MTVTEINLPALFDAHVHLRQDVVMERISYYSGACCSDVIAMPNTKPPIHDADRIKFMHDRYKEFVGSNTTVHMVAKWLPHTTPQDVIAARNAGVIGFKLYPQGATTNAEDGIPYKDLIEPTSQIMDVLGEMEKQKLTLMCHGEAPGFVLDREYEFIKWFEQIGTMLTGLSLTLEHISTAAGLDAVKRVYTRRREASQKTGNVLGTITLHHMMRTLDDVIGGKLRPDEFCMPVPKRPEDRDALLDAAMSGNELFALGSDSAPHMPDTKYCSSGCAGVFTAPVLAASLVELFEKNDELDNFEKFCTRNACAFYGIEPSKRTITLKKKDNLVPGTSGLVTPFRSGEKLPWILVDY